ncbi:nucleotide disphospho-sugar-binding domain-containing protein [Crossiella sp. CA198]|uniref:nucleotide disphospho-sugar-binding domain-containing protein n=1 Tax=Crossiella sp. CA198 TaxID=3455607 RepID=UPI003F8D4464
MRILFAPLPQVSHYFHLVPLGWACRAAGHEVRVAAQPALAEHITRSGLTGVPLSEVAADGDWLKVDMAALTALPPEQRLRKLREVRTRQFVAMADAAADDLVSFAKSWQPDLVVADPLNLAAPLVSETLGVPLVHHLWSPDVARHLGYPGLGLPVAEWPTELIELYQRFGLEIRPGYARHTIDPCPDSLQSAEVPDRIPMRYVPYNGNSPLPDWLRQPAGRPRVCVSWGYTHNPAGGGGSRLPEVVAALAAFDVEVVVAVAKLDSELLGDLPADVRVVAELPLQLLLPTCSAVVHHGGGGTMFTAAVYGVPQVVVIPDAIAAALLTGPLSDCRIGVCLESDASVDEIKSAVGSVLADSAQEGIQRLRKEILATPTPAAIVPRLEALVAQRS